MLGTWLSRWVLHKHTERGAGKHRGTASSREQMLSPGPGSTRWQSASMQPEPSSFLTAEGWKSLCCAGKECPALELCPSWWHRGDPSARGHFTPRCKRTPVTRRGSERPELLADVILQEKGRVREGKAHLRWDRRPRQSHQCSPCSRHTPSCSRCRRRCRSGNGWAGTSGGSAW